MKKILSIVVALIFSFSYIGTTYANANEGKKVLDMFSHEIKSIETGDVVGLKTIEFISEKVTKDINITEIKIKSDITIEDYRNENEELETQESTLIYEDGILVSVDGREIDSNNDFEIRLSKMDQDNIKPLAEEFKKGNLSYDEYIEAVGNLNLNLYNSPQLYSSGGLSWITYYYTSSRDGYWLAAGKMKGFFDAALNSFMLDPSAAKEGSIISKHNRLSSSQGGLVSSFMTRADSIESARNTLLIEAAALMGLLGVAVLTVATIWGAILAGGAAGAVALRMWNTSSAAHTDIERAYELCTTINTIQ